jgi:TetR/AcrR family transcriptional regulator, cholesterol catabolism regulator
VSTGESTPPGDPDRPRPGRRRRRAAGGRDATGISSTRVEILKSAAAAFRRLGYHGATVEQIAAALHMKKGNLYYYFRNKEEILFACHQYSLERLLALLNEVELGGLPPDEKIRRLIVAFVHTILDELHGTALFLDLEAMSPAHLKTIVAGRDRFDHGMRKVLEEGIRTGVFAQADAKLLSFAILGAVNWIPRWYSPEGPASSQEIADRFADYLISGLRRA